MIITLNLKPFHRRVLSFVTASLAIGLPLAASAQNHSAPPVKHTPVKNGQKYVSPKNKSGSAVITNNRDHHPVIINSTIGDKSYGKSGGTKSGAAGTSKAFNGNDSQVIIGSTINGGLRFDNSKADSPKKDSIYNLTINNHSYAIRTDPGSAFIVNKSRGSGTDITYTFHGKKQHKHLTP